MEAGKERLARDSVRDATRHEVELLKRENTELCTSWERYRLNCTVSKQRR